MSKENSSSSGVLFARPTKEWVVPQRAKPGRKSTKQNVKNDCATAIGSAATSAQDADGRTTAGNRDAQRAFRERKTEYVASLEARIEAYEKGEIKRNVALQVSARATKEENVRLKAEVDSKTQELAAKDERCRKLEKVVVELRRRLNAATEVARKLSSQQYPRSRASTSTSRRGSDAFSSTLPSASSPAVSISSPPMRLDMPISPPNYDADQQMTDSAMMSRPPPPNRVYSSSALAQSPHDSGYHGASAHYDQFSQTQNRDSQMQMQQQRFGMSASIEVTSIPAQGCGIKNSSKTSTSDDFVPCGFCSGMESICVCRSIEENDKTLSDTSLTYFNKSQGIQLFQPQSGIDSIVHAAKHQEAFSQSILEKLPAPEAAVPLRRRRARASGVENAPRIPIFAVQPVNFAGPGKQGAAFTASNSSSGIYTSASSGFESGVVAMMQDKGNGMYIPPAECSGDPKNCPACKDDDFGREFCETLSTAVCNTGDPNHRCDNCADRPLPTTAIPVTRINTPTDATVSNTRGSGADTGTTSLQKGSTQPSDGMEYVDIPCCGDKTLCGASAEDDCKTSIAIPIIPMNEHEDDVPQRVAGEMKENGDKVRGLAGGQEGSWMESEKWIGKEPVGADQAWRTLKAHPNAKSCPLSMLAEVVARGTRYTFSPSRHASPAPSTVDGEHGPDERPRMSLVPLEELEGTGKRRRFEIHPDAVQRALAMLDAHPAHPNKKRRLSDIRDEP